MYVPPQACETSDVEATPRDKDSYHVFQADWSIVQVRRKEVKESGALVDHHLKVCGVIKLAVCQMTAAN